MSLYIIKPKAEIVESTGSVIKDIERVGRVCYKTEDKITDNSAESFVNRIIDRKHLSVLEFGMIRATCPLLSASCHIREEMVNCAYLKTTIMLDNTVTVTGSVRAFREFLQGAISYDFGLRRGLKNAFPSLFDCNDRSNQYAWSFDMPWDTHTLVKFTVNRNMTHELVRHRVFSFMQESQRYCRYDEELTVIEPNWFHDVPMKTQISWENHMQSSHERYKIQREVLSPQESRDVLPTATKAELYMLGSNEKWKAFFDLRCSSGADPEMRRVTIPLKEEFKSTGRI